jgi:hypothetical protein
LVAAGDWHPDRDCIHHCETEAALMEAVNDGVISEMLKPTDELCHRWAQQVGDWEGRKSSSTYRAMMAAAGVLLEPGFPPQIAPDVAVLAKLLSHCKVSEDNHWVYSIRHTHYCGGGSSDQKARRLHIARTKYYELVRLALSYLRGRLQDRGLKV